MRNRTRLVAAAALALAVTSGAARAYAPSVADLDAAARSTGNRRDVAERIGQAVFASRWPAEVSQISVNQLGKHVVVGVRVWGVKFARPITRAQFVDEVVTVVSRSFAAAPQAEEVDLWASVPVDVTKTVVVSGDLAKPTSRTVFSITVRRGEPESVTRARASHAGGGAYWDEEWAQAAFARAA